jgi:type IV pilus assembly protein PilY1
MRALVLLSLLLAFFWVHSASADDIEAYLYSPAVDGAYIQVVMDTGDADIDGALCTYGIDCGPPFMTAAAHQHLGDMYSNGQVVAAPGVFKAVLAAVLDNPLLDNLQLSLLISNHPDNVAESRAAGVGGGAILRGYRRLEAQREAFLTTLKAIPTVAAANSHTLQPVETYFEWIRYIRGASVALGQNTAGNFGSSDPVPNYDKAVLTAGKYLTPLSDAQACPQLYSILFTLGSPGRDDDLDTEIAAEMNLVDLGSFEAFLAYLHRSTTDLLPQVEAIVPLEKTWVVTSRDRAGNAAQYALAGGTGLLYVDEPVVLQDTLTQALIDIVAVPGRSLEAAFANDVFNRGEMLDTLLLPFFLPQATANWPGNLKKLKLKSFPDGDPTRSVDVFDEVIDARGDPAFELAGDGKGRLHFDALTFWTDVATLPSGSGIISDNADGPFVARGGAGQKLDGFVPYASSPGEPGTYFIGDANSDLSIDGYSPRQLFYEPEGGQELAALDANAATINALGPLLDPDASLSEEALLDLIRWARGQDTDNGKSTARGWIMGPVMHSRPFALNYGATPGYSRDNPNIRVLFGSGDGLFHILENTDSSGRESGREVFGFYPRESLAAVRWRHDDSSTGLPRYYGVDGTPAVLRVDRNADGTLDPVAGDEAYVYFGLRRGGSSYYALDISNPGEVPRLLWKISRTSGGDFDQLGLTFSTPVVGKVNYSGVPVDVLIFAAGYDGGWNEDFTARRGKDLAADDDTVGNAIYIVNARSGELVWKAVRGNTGVSSNTRYLHAGLVDSVPSTVASLQTPGGIIHRLYVGDSGGAVWRVDLPPNPGSDESHRRDHWFITKLADLGSDAAQSGGSARDDRRFFHAPDLVQSYDSIGTFDGVLIQSGNRAEPNEMLVENALFYIKDREVTSGSPLVQAENEVNSPPGRFEWEDLLDQSTCTDGTEEEVGENGISCAEHIARDGWKVRFEQPGEKGLSSPLTDGGRVFASTFIPGETTACSNRQGSGRLYVMRLRNATPAANYPRHYELGVGIPTGVLSVGNAIYLPGGGIDMYDMDEDGVRDTVQLLPSEAQVLYRTHWREPGIDPL